MFDLNSYNFTFFSLPLLLAAAVCLSLGITTVARERLSIVSINFFVLALAISTWLFGSAWLFAAVDATTAEGWSRLATAAVAIIPAAALQFGLIFLKLQNRFAVPLWAGWFTSIFFCISAFASDLFVDGTYSMWWGFYPRYQILGLFFTIFAVLVLLANQRVYLTQFNAARHGSQRSRILWIMLGMGASYMVAVDFLAAYGLPIYPFGYVGMTAFLSICAWTIWKYHVGERSQAAAAPSVLETMADGLIVLDHGGSIGLVNPATVEVLGYEEHELLGRRLEDALEDTHFTQQLRELIANPDVRDGEINYRERTGINHVLHVTITPVLGGNKQGAATVCLLRDITAQKRAAAALDRNSSFVELLQVVAVAANEADTVEEAVQTTLNSVCMLTKWPLGHYYYRDPTGATGLISTPIWHISDPQHYKQFTRVLSAMSFAPGSGLPGQVLATGRPAWATDLLQYDLFLRARVAKDVDIHSAFAFPVLAGQEVMGVMEFFSNNVVEPDAALLEIMAPIGVQLGRVIERQKAREEIRLLNQDLERRIEERTAELEIANRELQNEIADRKRAEATLQELATKDEVTGLINRREMNRLLKDELYRARRYKRPVSLVMADIDHFKRVNDTFGHQVGDAVLRWVANLLRNNIRSTDRLARYGGEEMALILPETEANDAFTMSEHLRKLLQDQPFTRLDTDGSIVQVPITMSFGVARLTEDMESEEALIAAADEALYKAKHTGRNRTVLFAPDVEPKLVPVPTQPIANNSIVVSQPSVK